MASVDQSADVRLAGLQVIDDAMATRLFKIYSAKGYARREPGDDLWPLQEPRLFREALQVIVDEGVRTPDDLRHVDFLLPFMPTCRVERLAGSGFPFRQVLTSGISNQVGGPMGLQVIAADGDVQTVGTGPRARRARNGIRTITTVSSTLGRRVGRPENHG